MTLHFVMVNLVPLQQSCWYWN